MNKDNSLENIFVAGNSGIDDDLSVDELIYDKLVQYGKSKQLLANPTIIGDVEDQPTAEPTPTIAMLEIRNKIHRHQPLSVNDFIELRKGSHVSK